MRALAGCGVDGEMQLAVDALVVEGERAASGDLEMRNRHVICIVAGGVKAPRTSLFLKCRRRTECSASGQNSFEAVLYLGCGEDGLERARVEAFFAEQLAGQAIEQVAVLAQDRGGARVAFVEQAADLVVDLLADVLRVVLLLAHVAAEKDHRCFLPKATGPSRSLMPHSLTILRTMLVARWMSSPAPVLISSKTTASAAWPPSAAVTASMKSLRVM